MHIRRGAVHAISLYCAGCLVATAVPFTQAAEISAANEASIIAFAGLNPGDKVAQFLPPSGEFIQVLCKAVGNTGHVYAISAPATPAKIDAESEQRAACSNATAGILKSRNFPAPELYDAVGDPGAVYEYYQSRLPVESFVAPEPLDMILIADRYHDLHNKTFGTPNLTFVNTALFMALKSGGMLIVQDYAAKRASGMRDAAVLHRIEADYVKREVTTAGFEFVAESAALSDGSDLHTVNAHAVNKADRFLLKFRKP